MSNYSLIIRDAALRDAEKICEWYSNKFSNTEEKFKTELLNSFYKIRAFPEACFNVSSKSRFRRYLMDVFPYKIFYRIDGNVVVIVAIIHHSRSNKYIKRRLK